VMRDERPTQPDPRQGGYFVPSAAPRPEQSQPRVVEGTVIRFMWDEGLVGSPLWDEGGPLPDDATWMRERLGLTEQLAADLRQWGRDVYEVNFLAEISGAEREAQLRRLDSEATTLVARLKDELPSGLTVRHRPMFGATPK